MNRSKNIPSRLLDIIILVTLFLAQSWIKFPTAPAPFTSTYVMGFVIVVPLILSIGLWILTGFRGIHKLYQSKTSRLWFITLVAFASWAVLSQYWDFLPDDRAGTAQNAGLQIVLVFAFALVVFCHPPKLRWLLIVAILILLIQGIIGGLQVAQQSSIGLQFLGEFHLRPTNPNINAIPYGRLRWLRPYGLLPHPNVFAGVIVIGVFAPAGFFLSSSRRVQISSGICFLFGMWILWLSFSRGAWGSVALGILISLFFVVRWYGIKPRFITLAGLTIVLCIIFVFMYRPLFLTRVGATGEEVEIRSIANRIVYNQIALSAISNYPIKGIGAGNYPWYALHYLDTQTNYEVEGDNVHMVLLGIRAEYGLVGLMLIGINSLLAIRGIIRNIQQHASQRPERIAILGIIIAYIGIGLFDHYPWTIIHTQVIWFMIMASGLSIDTDTQVT